jgi:cytochrome c oxidase assembly protein subunit 15
MVISVRRYQHIAVGALVALSVIIVSGAAVRLTNSGLGCDDWPNCSSSRFVDVSSKHAAIEQINRLFTGVVAIAVIAAVLGSMVRAGGRRRDLVRLSWLLVVGVLANAVLGGISVLVDLHPIAVQGHLLLSMGLIVTGAVLVRRSGEPDGVPRSPVVRRETQWWTWVLFGLTWVAVFTGTLVTGAGPHAGDEEAKRLDIATPDVARIHSISVLSAIAVAVAIAWRLRRSASDRSALTNVLSTWIFVGLLQAAIGYIQYFNDVPALLVGLHVAGATLVMLVSTQVVLDTTRPVEASGAHTDRVHEPTVAEPRS